MNIVFSLYNIFDIALFIIIVIFIYIGYKSRNYLKFFEYFKIFTIVTLSSYLAYPMGVVLQKFYILKSDTYMTLILIAFGLNIALFYFGWKSLVHFFDRFISSTKVRVFFAWIVSALEVIAAATFTLYFIMQIYIVRIYLYKPLHKTYSYPKIERFYKHFLNGEFVNMILHADTGTNSKEVLFKSLKSSL